MTDALVVGRYTLHGALASGGMATVHIGRLRGPVGFSRTIAIKRLHPQFARDPEFVAMFLDEARLAARIRHPNVVPTLDVVSDADELFLVMEYVQGETLARAWRTVVGRGQRIPSRIASAIVVGALHGLHAAHEARDEQGRALDVVHRDVSPQNILIGADGVPRVLDFGVAKAAGRAQQTREGQLKGKLAYMAPEQFRREPATRLVDVYAASVVLWEALTGQRLNAGDNEAAVVERVLFGEYRPPSAVVGDLPRGIDGVLSTGLAREPRDRFETARDLAVAVEGCLGAASTLEVAAWIAEIARPELDERARLVETVEATGSAAETTVAVAVDLSAATAAAIEPRIVKRWPTLTETLTAPSDEPAPGIDASRLVAPPAPRRWLAIASGAFLAMGIAASLLAHRPSAVAPIATAASSLPPPQATLPSTTQEVADPAPPAATASSPVAAEASSGTARHPKPAARPPKLGPKPDKGSLPRGLPTDRD